MGCSNSPFALLVIFLASQNSQDVTENLNQVNEKVDAVPGKKMR